MKVTDLFTPLIEDVSGDSGKFIGARLTRESEKLVADWMRDNGVRKKEPRSNFHVTVVGDPKHDFPWTPAVFEPNLEIDPHTYKIEKFDEVAIVLTFSAPELEARHEQCCKDNGIDWSFPTYQPHLTLSFDPNGLNDIERFVVPTFPIYIKGEYATSWNTETESDSDTPLVNS